MEKNKIKKRKKKDVILDNNTGNDILPLSLSKKELVEQVTFLRNYKKRVDGLMDVMLKYTLRDFSVRAELSGRGDELDALSAGLNTLGEELDAALLAERKQLQELEISNSSIRESKEQVEAIIKNAPNAVVVINEEGHIIEWNPKSETVFGWKEEDVMGKPMHLVIMPERYRPMHLQGLKHFLQTGEGMVIGKTLELSALRKNGEEFPIELSISSAKRKEKYVFIAFINDISERKKAEESINQTNKFLDSILENIPNMIFVKDAKELRFVRFNKAGEDLIGYSRSDLIGKNDYDFFPGEEADFFTQKDRQVLQQGRLFDIPEEPIHTRHKGVRWLHTQKIPITDEKGNPLFLLGISDDITERKQAEEQIRQLNKDLEQNLVQLELANRQLAAVNNELEAFSYSVSHDLRAPLRAVYGYSRIILEEYKGKIDAELNRLLDIIMLNTKRMGQLIDDLLAFSRAGRKEMSTLVFQMEDLVHSVIHNFNTRQSQRPIHIRVHQLPGVKGDSSLMRQVWENMISNAIKYSGTREKTEIEIGFREEKDEYIFWIKDNGVGFNMQYREKLFGVFQRLHSNEEFEGTGVGLAIVQRIVNRHNGRVWAESKINEGATFYFSLPK